MLDNTEQLSVTEVDPRETVDTLQFLQEVLAGDLSMPVD